MFLTPTDGSSSGVLGKPWDQWVFPPDLDAQLTRIWRFTSRWCPFGLDSWVPIINHILQILCIFIERGLRWGLRKLLLSSNWERCGGCGSVAVSESVVESFNHIVPKIGTISILSCTQKGLRVSVQSADRIIRWYVQTFKLRESNLYRGNLGLDYVIRKGGLPKPLGLWGE